MQMYVCMHAWMYVCMYTYWVTCVLLPSDAWKPDWCVQCIYIYMHIHTFTMCIYVHVYNASPLCRSLSLSLWCRIYIMYVWVSPLLLLTNTLVLFAYLCHFAIIRVIRAHPLTHLLPVLLACLLTSLPGLQKWSPKRTESMPKSRLIQEPLPKETIVRFGLAKTRMTTRRRMTRKRRRQTPRACDSTFGAEYNSWSN